MKSGKEEQQLQAMVGAWYSQSHNFTSVTDERDRHSYTKQQLNWNTQQTFDPWQGNYNYFFIIVT